MPLVPKIHKRTIALIDSANLAFRYAHTFRGHMLKMQSGVEISTGIIFGMLDTIWKLKQLYKINNAIFVLEGPHETNPRRKHPIYKSKRATSISIDITSEMILLQELAPQLGIPVVVPQIGEADDGIGHLIKKLHYPFSHLLICSGDHDMQVFLDNTIKIIKSANKSEQNITTVTTTEFWAEYGFDPKYFSLFLAVTGDSSDCIPGIKGIGPKKGKYIFNELSSRGIQITIGKIARELIRTYPKIIDGQSQEQIESQIIEYYQLTKIRNDWPISIIRPIQPNIKQIIKLFELMKMRVFINRIEEIYNICDTFYKESLRIIPILSKGPRIGK
jgi:5'-3' exonuclease